MLNQTISLNIYFAVFWSFCCLELYLFNDLRKNSTLVPLLNYLVVFPLIIKLCSSFWRGIKNRKEGAEGLQQNHTHFKYVATQLIYCLLIKLRNFTKFQSFEQISDFWAFYAIDIDFLKNLTVISHSTFEYGMSLEMIDSTLNHYGFSAFLKLLEVEWIMKGNALCCLMLSWCSVWVYITCDTVGRVPWIVTL